MEAHWVGLKAAMWSYGTHCVAPKFHGVMEDLSNVLLWIYEM